MQARVVGPHNNDGWHRSRSEVIVRVLNPRTRRRNGGSRRVRCAKWRLTGRRSILDGDVKDRVWTSRPDDRQHDAARRLFAALTATRFGIIA